MNAEFHQLVTKRSAGKTLLQLGIYGETRERKVQYVTRRSHGRNTEGKGNSPLIRRQLLITVMVSTAIH